MKVILLGESKKMRSPKHSVSGFLIHSPVSFRRVGSDLTDEGPEGLPVGLANRSPYCKSILFIDFFSHRHSSKIEEIAWCG